MGYGTANLTFGENVYAVIGASAAFGIFIGVLTTRGARLFYSISASIVATVICLASWWGAMHQHSFESQALYKLVLLLTFLMTVVIAFAFRDSRQHRR